MKLVFLIGHFPPGPFGGAEAQAEQWALHLSERHAVTVVTRRDPPDQPQGEERGRYRVIRTPVSRVPLWRTAADLRAIESAVRALPENPDLMLCFQTFVSGLAGVRLQRRRGIPAVVWIRGESEYHRRRSMRERWVGPRVWEEARGVLVQSEAVRRAFLAELGTHAAGLAAKVEAKLRVVPNGIELPLRPALPGTHVLALGRLIPSKGVDVVIEAVSRLPDARLVVAGDGPARPALEALARRRGAGVEFSGHVARERLPEIFARARCLVLAARAGEGFPNVLLEAMASGVPVIATPVAGVSDLVRDGANGLLVPPGDVGALRGAMERLLGDEALRARLSAAGRETAAGYAWDRVVPRLEAALREWAA
jgi:glycosyltransferase involved in cell wall biosynthesis